MKPKPIMHRDERTADKNARLILGGGAALMLALAAGTATMALMAHERPAIAQPAQPADKPYVQKDLGEQVAKARAATDRCDKVAARREIAKLKKNLELLQGAAKTGVVEGAAEDAKKLEGDINKMENWLANCKDTFKVTGPGGNIYGFASQKLSQEAGKYADDAQRAIRDCDRDFYKAVLKGIRDAIAKYRKSGVGDIGPADQGNNAMLIATSVQALIQLERDLTANEEEAFKKCDPPGKADPPKADAPKPEPAKSGTGTGGTGQPVKPPEPPKAPADSPSMGQMPPGMVAPLIFRPGDVLLGALLVPTAEFSIAIGVRNNNADGHYTGTLQAPGSGSGSESNANIGGGATIWFPLFNFETGTIMHPFGQEVAWNALRPQYAQLAQDLDPSISDLWIAFGILSVGGRVTVDYLGDGRKSVLELVRHGPTGAVELTESERTMVSLLLLVRFTFLVNFAGIGFPSELAHQQGDQFADTDIAQAPRARRRANWWPVSLYAGGGPSFVRTKITMTSNQAPGGGVFQSVSETKTDTAWSFVLGAQTAACRNCIFGRPLMLGVEGQWTWMPDRSVSIRSSTFGFTETGRVTNRSSARVMFTASVPFTIGR